MGKVKGLIRVEVTKIVVTPQEISVKNILAEFVVEYTEITLNSRDNGKKRKNQLRESYRVV
jgi:predicted RNA-binding protein YlqC (UPF0109 family)